MLTARIKHFVGRSEELASLDRAVAGARGGLPGVLLLGGEAGIGKSTLISEGAARAGVALYLGRCVHIGGDVIPLAPLTDLLRQVSRSRPAALTTPTVAPLARWLTRASDTPQDTDSDRGGLFVAVLNLIGHLAADDAVIVGLEDLHWADTVTWDLFEFLARNLTDERVLLVGSYRVDEIRTDASQRRRLAELPRLPGVHRMHLSGLDRTGVSAHVAGLMGEPAPQALVDEILARGQGNPFFTEQLVAAHAAGEAIPVVLSDLISADIAAMDADTRQVLGAVAVLGRPTAHGLLSRIVDLSDDAVETAVRTAIDAHVLAVDGDTDAYRFRHGLIGEVVYADLLPSQRARLHRRVAEVLREESPDVLTRADRAGELALHMDRAGEREAAFVALLAAADAAETVAPGAALRHLERAFELWDVVGGAAANASRSDRLWQAAELASGAISNQRAVELARTAFTIGPPPLGEPFGHERLGRYLWSSGDLDQATGEFERAASLLPSDAGPEAAPVFAGLAQAALMSGRYELAERWCRKVFVVVPEPAADPSAWVMARRVLGIVHSQLGHAETAVELCREAVAAATTAQTRALASIYLGVALVDAGRYVEAVDTAVTAAEAVQRAGLDGSFGGYLDALAAEGLLYLGRWVEVDAVLARRTGGDALPVGALRVACVGAMLAARRGEADRARALLADADAQPSDGLHQTHHDFATADVHLILGDWAAAAAAAERGWASNPVATVLCAARFAMLTVNAAVEQALDALARREVCDVAELVDHLRRRIDAVSQAATPRGGQSESPDVAAHLAHARATLSRLSGPDADAWGDAARRWRDLGDQWRMARARVREADAAASAGDAARAAASLRDAHMLATMLDAPPLQAEIQALSRRTRISVDPPSRVVVDERSASGLGLTPREAEVLTLVSGGGTNRQIGAELYISEKTVSVHISNIMRKLGVRSRVDAAAVAQRLGVPSSPATP